MNEQLSRTEHVANPDHAWIPFNLADLANETQQFEASHGSIAVSVDILLRAERAQLAQIDRAAEDRIEVEREHLREFERATRGRVLAARERSAMTETAIREKVVATDDLKGLYTRTGETLISEVRSYEALRAVQAELNRTITEKQTELAQKRIDQTVKSAESFAVKQKLAEATSREESSRSELKRRPDYTNQTDPILYNVRELEDVHIRSLTKRNGLESKRAGLITDMGLLSEEIHEIEMSLAEINTTEYPALIQKLADKKDTILRHRQSLHDMAQQMVRQAEQASTTGQKEAPISLQPIQVEEPKGITDETGETPAIEVAPRLSRHRTADVRTGIFGARRTASLLRETVPVITEARKGNTV